jgi:hypothetical protein
VALTCGSASSIVLLRSDLQPPAGNSARGNRAGLLQPARAPCKSPPSPGLYSLVPLDPIQTQRLSCRILHEHCYYALERRRVTGSWSAGGCSMACIGGDGWCGESWPRQRSLAVVPLSRESAPTTTPGCSSSDRKNWRSPPMVLGLVAARFPVSY